jgi:hypothetical protein
MSLIEIEYEHTTGDEYVTELTHTETQTAETYGHLPYRQLRVSAEDGQLKNSGSDTETIIIEVINGLQLARGETPADVLAYDGDVTVEIDGAETTKSMTGGSVSFDVTTSKPAGASISVRAVGLNNHPVESDSVSIKPVQ